MKIETVRRLNHIKALPVIGKEGQLGELRDAFFDLDAWVIRYLVMVARSNGREVLLSPLLFGDLDDSTDRLILSLFDEEIEAIPPLDLGRPVSREQELAYDLYFCIPDYWVDGAAWGTERTPSRFASRLRSSHSQAAAVIEDLRGSPAVSQEPPPVPHAAGRAEDPAQSRLLRGCELYELQARCENVRAGRPVDLLFDPETLAIRYLVLELSPETMHTEKKLLLPQPLIAGVSREARRLEIRLRPEVLAGAPEYKPGEPVTRAYEKNLRQHYGAAYGVSEESTPR
jgi:hypothetical protein